MSELKQSERFALVRHDAIRTLEAEGIPSNALEIKTGTFAWMTSFGPVKVSIVAVKDTNFDIGAEAAAFQAELEASRLKAEAKAQAKAEKASKGK